DELAEEFRTSSAHEGRKLGIVIGEVQEGCRGSKLLPLKKHRRLRKKQEQRGDGAVAPRTGHLVQAQSACRVGDLVVILGEVQEAEGRDVQRRRAAPTLLPLEPRALVQKPELRERNELLGGAAIATVVRLVATCRSDDSAVVKVVVPEAVEPIASLCRTAYQARLLGLVLSHDDRRASSGSVSHDLGDLGKDVGRRVVKDLLSCVQAQAVEVELVDPVRRVLANSSRTGREC